MFYTNQTNMLSEENLDPIFIGFKFEFDKFYVCLICFRIRICCFNICTHSFYYLHARILKQIRHIHNPSNPNFFPSKYIYWTRYRCRVVPMHVTPSLSPSWWALYCTVHIINCVFHSGPFWLLLGLCDCKYNLIKFSLQRSSPNEILILKYVDFFFLK